MGEAFEERGLGSLEGGGIVGVRHGR
jgi:hypothetical protein